jgi:microcystin-dependent protein
MPKTTLLRKQVTPTGTIQPHAGGTAPDGFLVCDGTIVNIADYPRLFAVIGTSWGYGNNDGLTFHLPDLRGRFLRGVDDAAGRDPDSGARTASNMGGNSGDAVGSVQGDEFETHQHTQTRWITAGGGTIANERTLGPAFGEAATTQRTLVEGGNETRPVNANVTYVIKVV